MATEWMKHVKETMKAHKGAALSDVLKMAKKTYKKGGAALSPSPLSGGAALSPSPLSGGRRRKTSKKTKKSKKTRKNRK